MNDSNCGRVLLLIGPSSVGKSTVARELQRTLPGLWFLAGVDMFWGMLDESQLPFGEFRTDSESMSRVTRGWHRAVAALAAEGNDLIVDDLWTHDWWFEDWRSALDGITWWSVMLTAIPDALAARESERGDRPVGLAVSDLMRPVERAAFDLVVETSHLSAPQCAATIAEFLRNHDSKG